MVEPMMVCNLKLFYLYFFVIVLLKVMSPSQGKRGRNKKINECLRITVLGGL